eukprot:SAG31_NODE_287_length_18430_cov_8.127544_13_plen_178_part_00
MNTSRLNTKFSTPAAAGAARVGRRMSAIRSTHRSTRAIVDRSTGLPKFFKNRSLRSRSHRPSLSQPFGMRTVRMAVFKFSRILCRTPPAPGAYGRWPAGSRMRAARYRPTTSGVEVWPRLTRGGYRPARVPAQEPHRRHQRAPALNFASQLAGEVQNGTAGSAVRAALGAGRGGIPG